MIRPREDIALYRAEMAEWAGPDDPDDWRQRRKDWVRANDACRRDILASLDVDGPLPQSALPDTCAVPWSSSGWNNNRNRAMMLLSMAQRGEIAAAGRDGREQLWDLATRIYPDDVTPADDALRIRAQRRLRALGIARAQSSDVGEPAVVEGVRGTWRVDPAQLGQPFAGRAALLSPLDRLVFDRKRMTELFAFDYMLEMYKPAGKRRWGYFALPILYGDRLVGKLDATTDRKARVLRVDAIHRDVPFTAAITRAVDAEIRDLADWLGLALDVPA
jgi:uncharacterized protein YcaQ